MHNPKSVLENETHKILWDFETQTDHLISARLTDQVIVNKKENLPNSGLRRCDRQQSIIKRRSYKGIDIWTLLES